ncbi:MAG: hypothetical protein M1835_007134 [Candelina submexicana]|nr:MAG: hypothetical protein M1835_007134 [Candelina submexicana]
MKQASAVPLSTRELSQLTSGDRVQVYVGPNVDDRISLFPGGVFKDVLTYYSPHCHQELVVEKKASLWLDQVDQPMLNYAIQWMSAGGADQATRISLMDERKLLELYRLSNFLAIGVLEKMSLEYLAVKVQALKVDPLLRLYKDSARVQPVHNTVLRRLLDLMRTTPFSTNQIDCVYDITLAGSPLRKALIEGTANMIYSKRIADPATYKQYCLRNIEFAEGMKLASEEKFAAIRQCTHCGISGHTVQTCRKLLSKSSPIRRAVVPCPHCTKPGHGANQCWKLHPALAPVRLGVKICSHCSKRGHESSQCWEVHPELAPVRLFCSRCHKSDHNEENCWVLHPEKRPRRPTKFRPRDPNARGNITMLDDLMVKRGATLGSKHVAHWKPHKMGK